MGKLIVIEGLDGSGKATQTDMLYNRLLANNTPCKKISFPNYEEDTSALIKMYLAGGLGSLSDVGAYGASLFYTVDRYGSYLKNWKMDYDEGKVILCDRYTTSNIPHQMSKLPENEWADFIDWLYDLEFKKVGIPKPNQVIYLDVLPEVSKKLLSKRYENDEGKRDIHEADFEYLLKCRKAAMYGAEKLNWKVISCCNGDTIKPIEEIAENIFSSITVL